MVCFNSILTAKPQYVEQFKKTISDNKDFTKCNYLIEFMGKLNHEGFMKCTSNLFGCKIGDLKILDHLNKCNKSFKNLYQLSSVESVGLGNFFDKLLFVQIIENTALALWIQERNIKLYVLDLWTMIDYSESETSYKFTFDKAYNRENVYSGPILFKVVLQKQLLSRCFRRELNRSLWVFHPKRILTTAALQVGISSGCLNESPEDSPSSLKSSITSEVSKSEETLGQDQLAPKNCRKKFDSNQHFKAPAISPSTTSCSVVNDSQFQFSPLTMKRAMPSKQKSLNRKSARSTYSEDDLILKRRKNRNVISSESDTSSKPGQQQQSLQSNLTLQSSDNLLNESGLKHFEFPIANSTTLDDVLTKDFETSSFSSQSTANTTSNPFHILSEGLSQYSSRIVHKLKSLEAAIEDKRQEMSRNLELQFDKIQAKYEHELQELQEFYGVEINELLRD